MCRAGTQSPLEGRPLRKRMVCNHHPGGNMLVHGGLDCANERLGDMFQLNLHATPAAAH